MEAHVFYFKYPRLQEGLVHEVIDPREPSGVTALPCSSYIYLNGEWFLRTRIPDRRNKWISQLTTVPQEPHQVPKLIRTHLLLLT